MKTLTSCLLLAFLATTVFSQCPTFYIDYNLQGASFQLCTSSNVPAIYNDKVSSFTVPSGYTVTLYHDTLFSGEYWGPYTAGSYNVPTSFNDQLSSASVFPVQTQIPACPTFYINYGLQGNSIQLCASGNVPAGWNDIISSMEIPPGFAVQLFQNVNAGGSIFGPFNSGPWDVPAGINDQTSYVSISNYVDSDESDAELNSLQCPIFYFNSNLQGQSFQMCTSGNIPAADDNQASSFIVPKGYNIYIYGSNNYGGDYWGPYSEGRYNIPPNLNNQVSSVIINAPGGQPATINSVSNPVTTVTNTETTSVTNTETTNTNTETVSTPVTIPIPIIVPTIGTTTIPTIGTPTQNVNNNSNPNGNAVGGGLGGLFGGIGSSILGGLGSGFGSKNNINQGTSNGSGSCPTFYVDVNEGGNSFQLCSSGDVPSQYSNTVSSLVVPFGYTVTLYSGKGATGQRAGPYGQGKYNVPSSFNDQMDSAVITKLT